MRSILSESCTNFQSLLDLDGYPNSPSERYGHSTCVVGSMLYLFGGSSLDGKIFFNDLHIFDLSEKKWVEKIDAPEEIVGRHFHSCVGTKDDRLVFFGGKSNGYKNDVFTYEIQKREFKILRFEITENSIPPTARYGHSACYYSGNMYVFGGYDTNGFTKTDLHSFCLKSNVWRKFVIAKIPHRYHHSGVFLNGDYFILGGITKNYKPLNDVFRLELPKVSSSEVLIQEEEEEEEGENEENENEIDDYSVEAFKLSVQNPVASYGHKCFVFDNQIYMYGGRNEKKEFKHLLFLEQFGKYGDLRWTEISNSKVEEKKLNVSHGSLNVFNKQLLFFGGQTREEKKNINNNQKEEEKVLDMEELTDLLPYDTIFEIFGYLVEKEVILLAYVSKKWTISVAPRSDRLWAKKYKNEKSKSNIDISQMKIVKKKKTCFDKYIALKYQEYSNKLVEKENSKVHEIKITMVGLTGYGKTSLIKRYIYDRFDGEYFPSGNPNKKNLVVQKKKISVEISDTNFWTDNVGSVNFRDFTIRIADCLILAFPVICSETIEDRMEVWFVPLLEELFGEKKYRPPIIFCATKIDLRDDEEIKRELMNEYDMVPFSSEVGKQMADKMGFKYFEASAKTGEGVKECFEAAISEVLHLRLGELKKKEEKKEKCVVM